MLRKKLDTAVALITLAGATIGFVDSAAAEQKHHRYDRQEAVKIAVVSKRNPGVARNVSHYLKDYLPDNLRLVRNPYRADYVIELRERQLDKALRIKDKDYQWLKPKKRKGRRGDYGIHGRRIGWTEVSAIALAQYKYRVVLKDRHGRVVSKDRIQGRVKERARWGEDLRIATPRGYQPIRDYPNRRVERLFSQAPGTGNGPYAKVLNAVSYELAHKISSQILPYRQLYASNQRGDRYGYNKRQYQQQPYDKGAYKRRLGFREENY